MNLNDYALNAYSRNKGRKVFESGTAESSAEDGGKKEVRLPLFQKLTSKDIGADGKEIKETRTAAVASKGSDRGRYSEGPSARNGADDISGQKPLMLHRKTLLKPEPTLQSLAEDEKTRKQARLAAKSGTYFHKKNPTSQDVKEAASQLTSGGLIMVPEAEKKPGEKESIYRRVAKFLVVIGVDEAAKIIPHLSQEQTEKIIPEIAAVRKVSPEEAEEVLAEFESLVSKAREEGGLDTARTILTKAYGSQKAELFLQKAVKYPQGKPFDYLAEADAERVGILLDGESAAVKALVLSQLEPKKSAKIINAMELEDKKEVVLRLAKMKPVSPVVMEQINKGLYDKMLTQNTENSRNMDGRNVLAQILKRMDPLAESSIISSLSEQDPELGVDLRKRLFTEEDVLSCDDRYLQNKLHGMTDDDIVMLLRLKSDSFRKKILENISRHRAAAIIDLELEKEHLLKSDCERVTSQFFADLRRAWESGDLRIDGRDDDVYV